MDENIPTTQPIEQGGQQQQVDLTPNPVQQLLASQPLNRSSDAISQEELFKKLNTTISQSLIVIKALLWPAVIIFLFIGGFLGYSTYLKLGQLDDLRREMSDKKDEINKSFYDVKDQSYNILEKQKTIIDDQDKVSKGIANLKVEIGKLGTDTKNVTDRGNSLIGGVEVANAKVESLLNQTDNRLNEQKNYLDNNKKIFEVAQADIKTKQQLTENLNKQYQVQVDNIRQVNSLFVEYQVLIANGRSTFPDPNINRENEILNQIAVILYPDEKARQEFINQVTASTK